MERPNSKGVPSSPLSPPNSLIETSLAEAHRDAFRQAVDNVLDTDGAEQAYAQIIDGLPLSQVAADGHNGGLPFSHPIREEHKELCPGAIEKTRDFRAHFDPKSLALDAEVSRNGCTALTRLPVYRLAGELIWMDTKLVSAFGTASPGSRVFNVKLIELVVEAIHAIAVQLFNLDQGFHKDNNVTRWAPPPDDIFWDLYPEGVWPTLFCHHWYSDHMQYPNGVADIVGFWAESQIFGGVVLFDRRDPNQHRDADPYSVWLHADRQDITYRIYKLLDYQKMSLLSFLTARAPDAQAMVLPLLGDMNNTQREDPEEPLEKTGIYRHLWDRKPLGNDASDARLKDVWSKFDYPTHGDFNRAQGRAYDRKATMWK